MYIAPDDYLMLSGIQHYFFCKRQWCLIHIENLWQENKSTMEGKYLHERVDDSHINEKRDDLIISRGMNVSSSKLGFSGRLDVVEFRKSKSGVHIKGRKGLWHPTIVEYKKGKRKKDLRDVVQLVAELICLEESIAYSMNEAYLYYNTTRTRERVEVNEELRELVYQLAIEMREVFLSKKTLRAENYKNCKLCSLKDLCMPRLTKKKTSVSNYIIKNIND